MTKRCTKCGQELAASQFYKNKKIKSGLMSACKKCTNDSCRQWELRNPDKTNDYRRASKYGITASELNVLMSIPSCQSCGLFIENDHQAKIDHCHSDGHIRGILCHKCNIACAGSAAECVNRLLSCVEYLRRDSERVIEQARAV